jgi:TetR/AcrR family transcriptional regulator
MEHHMSSRREREKEERRKYILEKAQSLFAEKGYLKTSMAEIAEASEFAVGSLYSFFDSKEEILATIFEYHIERILDEEKKILNAPDMSAREKIEASLESLVKLYIGNMDFFRIYVAEAPGVEWGVRTEVGEYIHNGTVRYLNLLSEIFRQGIGEGIVDPNLDPEYLALLLRSFVHSTVSHSLYGSRGVSVDDLVPLAKRMLFDGIRPLPDQHKMAENATLFPSQEG